MCAQGIPENEPCAGGIQQVFWGSQSRGSRSFRISPRDGRAEDVVCADGRPHPAKVSARATARSDRRFAHDGQSKEKSRAFRPGICVGRNSHAFGCGCLSFALCGKAFLPPLLRGQCGRALPPFPSLRIQSLFSRLNHAFPRHAARMLMLRRDRRKARILPIPFPGSAGRIGCPNGLRDPRCFLPEDTVAAQFALSGA